MSESDHRGQPEVSGQVIDVFNGDADGICALLQLRLAHPRPEARLITGVKRDIELLDQLAEVSEAEITVLDISLDRNRRHLLALLAPERNNRVFYADHHHAGEIPVAANFSAEIDPDPQLCTALIIDRLLAGRFRPWAVVGAFGDNLHGPARRAAATLELSETELGCLRELGELLNYNGYGAQLSDLHCHPAQLCREAAAYADPLAFYRDSPRLARLRQGFADDMARARTLEPLAAGTAGRVFLLPAAAWSRRVAGVFANELARSAPDQAHALLVADQQGHFLVSVRAPLNRLQGADTLCRAFPTGGGRAGAAGINALPAEQQQDFLRAFNAAFG